MVTFLKTLFKQQKPGNLYHCCIQKTASQWVKKILSDKMVLKKAKMDFFSPGKDFITETRNRELLKKPFTPRTIISPLYVTYDQFRQLPKHTDYKALWVMRDIRDIIVSQYFSITYSHQLINDNHRKTREKLQKMPFEESFTYFINKVYPINNPGFSYYIALNSWLKADKDKNVLLCKYEEIGGENQHEAWKKIFDHFAIPLTAGEITGLLEKYSFEKLSGRQKGDENKNAHLRKGVAGDWRNYLNDQHKQLFKEYAGDLLVQSGYEKDDNW